MKQYLVREEHEVSNIRLSHEQQAKPACPKQRSKQDGPFPSRARSEGPGSAITCQRPRQGQRRASAARGRAAGAAGAGRGGSEKMKLLNEPDPP